MSHYILIHGAWEQAKSWDFVTPELEKQGHSVTALDLPGHGNNEQPISQMTMDNYIDAVIDEINRLDHQVILVGHSMTGTVISQVAERIPEKIERLIYVAAFLLKNGETVLETMQSDTEGEFFPEVVFSDDQSYATIPEEALKRVGFHDMDDKVIAQVLPLMVQQQSTEPFMAKVVVTSDRFGLVPKTYIRTSADKVTTPGLQDRMIANWKIDSVLEIQSGHFPLFSVPKKLAELLLAEDCCSSKTSPFKSCSVEA